MNPHDETLDALTEALDDAYHEAVAADPGLPEALRLALEEDPDTGWLDVAEQRERERQP